ncbi:MAG: hypothetical protein U9R19_04200 [Bacteroidota bacterium]|nr:hypothetical protein [Bacteroidota bacterium]
MDMKKESLLKFISILLILVLFTFACGKVYCPAFPADETDWFPYSIGDKLEFTNGFNTTILPVVDYQISESYSFSKQCDCLCEASMWFKTGIDSLNLLSIETNITYYYKSTDQIPPPININIRWYIFDSKLGLLIPMGDDKFYCDEHSAYQYHDSLQVNGKMYSDVVDIQDNSGNFMFSGVKIARGYGIIELTQCDSIIWNMVNQ